MKWLTSYRWNRDTKLIFLRRTPKEIEIFGGEVFIDVDGRNVGILGTTDFIISVSKGNHKIKMYKSHTYGSFIGNAEVEICISEGERLLIKYSPPMLLNQPGNIMISDFKSSSQADELAKEKEEKITIDDNDAKHKKHEQETKTQNGTIIFVIIMILIVIFYAISVSSIYN